MKIEKSGTGIILALLLTGCGAIAEHQSTAKAYEIPTGTLTRTFTAFFLSAAEIHAICGGSQACERNGDVFLQQRGDWVTQEYTLTWRFECGWPEMDGTTICSKAWPDYDLLGELLADNLGLPAGDYAYHRLLAEEIMHGFGMEHGDE